MKRSFRPEFLNRLDEIIYFKPLTKDNISRIVELAVSSLAKRLEDKRITVKITEAAKAHIIDAAYDPIYGARPLKRYLQSEIETLIARKIIAEDISPDSEITVDYDGELKIN